MFLTIGLLAVHMLAAQPPGYEDCIPYDTNNLTIKLEAPGEWLLSAGSDHMATFPSKDDAQNGLALASRYSEHCFIGRHRSARTNVTHLERRRYVVDYWKGSTGKQTPISPETCQSYVESALRAHDNGPAGWTVTDGKNFKMLVDNASDAKRLIALAHQYTAHCTIGAADPPVPAIRVDYWK